MIDYEVFKKIIDNIQEKHEFIKNKLWDILNEDIVDELFKLVDISVDLLSKLLGDDKEWLEYWIYDCEYGKKPKKVTVDGVDIDLSDSKKFYDFLISQKY